MTMLNVQIEAVISASQNLALHTYLAEKAKAIREAAGRAFIEIGKHLKEVQARLSREKGGEGGFVEWIEKEFEFGRAHAYRLMRLSDIYGSGSSLPHVVNSKLSLRALLELADAPEDLRNKILEEAQDTHFTEKQVKARIEAAEAEAEVTEPGPEEAEPGPEVTEPEPEPKPEPEPEPEPNPEAQWRPDLHAKAVIKTALKSIELAKAWNQEDALVFYLSTDGCITKNILNETVRAWTFLRDAGPLPFKEQERRNIHTLITGLKFFWSNWHHDLDHLRKLYPDMHAKDKAALVKQMYEVSEKLRHDAQELDKAVVINPEPHEPPVVKLINVPGQGTRRRKEKAEAEPTTDDK
jgi:hypothetical protein